MMPDDAKPQIAENPAPAAHPDVSHQALALYAHELRGALTVIAGYTDLLRLDLSEAERASALDGIERAIRRADGLCSDALSGRAPAARHDRATERVSLLALAEDVAADQRTATARTVEVIAEKDDVVVSGERDPLSRALANVVGNALKYSPPSTRVEVRVSRQESLALGDTAVLEVADCGPGIPADARSRVFEPFERLERDHAMPGTGLGLVVVREVIEAHGGRVEIRDRTGGGTVVRMELPLAD